MSTGTPLAAGQASPHITLFASDGTEVRVAELWQARPLVLAFFGEPANPFSGDNAAQLRDAEEAFDAVGVGVAGVVPAGEDATDAFDQRYTLPYLLLCDPSRAGAEAYAVAASAVFVIDVAGVVRYARYGANAADYPPTAELLRVCSEITGNAVPEPPAAASPGLVMDDVPASSFGRRAGATPGTITCIKCRSTSFERNQISTAGGFLSRIFNFQHRKFEALTCMGCGYTELYKRRSGALANISDLLAG